MNWSIYWNPTEAQWVGVGLLMLVFKLVVISQRPRR